MAQIVVVGEILVEIMATEVGQSFRKPGLFAAPFPSGAPAIFADQAARTGARVALIGTVGQDEFGTVNLDRLRASGVDVSRVRRHPRKPTGTAFVTYARDGSRSFVFNIAHSAAVEILPDQLDPACFLDCRFFHAMGSSLTTPGMVAAIERGITLAKAAGAEISFDPNIRRELIADPAVAEAIRGILARTDILLPSEDDLRYLFPQLTVEQAAEELLARGVRLVALKLGRRGCTLFERTGRTHVPPIEVEEVDPTGAGDCFGGAFLSCLLQGLPRAEALVFANAAGSLAVTVRGPMEGNAGMAELKLHLESHARAKSAFRSSGLEEMVQLMEGNRAGRQRAIYSVCSANRLVLEAAFDQARQDDSPLLIEATCNQVNQYGGYTGMTPAQFRDSIHELGLAAGYPLHRLILGGDHLGPNPWRDQAAAVAMRNACTMVAAFAAAGFAKIHLDASMPCSDDPPVLTSEQIAERAAQLCAAAEAAAAGLPQQPVYVIGTEVPAPGGAQDELEIGVTTTASVREMLEVHRSAFAARGLAPAFARVMGVVVQPGVEFGDETIADFVPAKARSLGEFILAQDGIVFEAHSTDYQTADALQALVAGHFGILKVGPELTFVLREALFALARIEDEWIAEAQRSHLRAVLESVMLAQPEHWKSYYRGEEAQLRFARSFSLSDRIRYYWPNPQVAQALAVLIGNLEREPAPLPLLSQYLPRQAEAVRIGALANNPVVLIRHRIQQSLTRYAKACGLSG